MLCMKCYLNFSIHSSHWDLKSAVHPLLIGVYRHISLLGKLNEEQELWCSGQNSNSSLMPVKSFHWLTT